MTDLYEITRAKNSELPIIIDIPHSGTSFPAELLKSLKPRYIDCPEDADWFLEQIYDFAPDLGITTFKANYSRYVIDLNRDPSGAKLYHDQRSETSLVPLRSFAGDELYSIPPNQTEVNRRLELYFKPYYEALQTEIDRLCQKFDHVLLFDAHSIRHHVPSIRDEVFPDFILSNAEGLSSRPQTYELMVSCLGKHKTPDQILAKNHPFKGGHITRSFHHEQKGVETIQLEMCQNLYMDEENFNLVEKAKDLQLILKSTIAEFAKQYAKL